MIFKESLAVNVKAKVKLHRAFEFRDEDMKNQTHDGKTLIKQLYNVDEDTEFTFEYRLRGGTELAELDINLEELKDVPFQT